MIDNLHDPENIKKKLNDLEILNKLRRKKENKRDIAYLLFVYAILMKYLNDDLSRINTKLYALYNINSYSCDINVVQVVIEKIRESNIDVLPSYQIISMLNITDEEQKSLSTIINKKERNSRSYASRSETSRQATRIRKAQLSDRIKELRDQRKTFEEIGNELGVSKGTVHNYLKSNSSENK